jgi:hypothetical protein
VVSGDVARAPEKPVSLRQDIEDSFARDRLTEVAGVRDRLALGEGLASRAPPAAPAPPSGLRTLIRLSVDPGQLRPLRPLLSLQTF